MEPLLIILRSVFREKGLVFSEALGHVMLLSGLAHIFSTPAEQCKMMIRIHWLKVHLYLIQENSSLAINSLQDVRTSFHVTICAGSVIVWYVTKLINLRRF